MDATSPGFAPGRGPSAPAGLAVSLPPASLPRMLPSPATSTSTPFSVKDILKLEQQQQQQQRLGAPLEAPFAPAVAASCLLSCRFSDREEDDEGEEQQPFLPPMASTKSRADGGFSPGGYVQAVLRGTCEPKGPAEEAEPAQDSGTGESGRKVGRALGLPALGDRGAGSRARRTPADGSRPPRVARSRCGPGCPALPWSLRTIPLSAGADGDAERGTSARHAFSQMFLLALQGRFGPLSTSFRGFFGWSLL